VRSSFRNLTEVEAEGSQSGKLYREFLRVPAMSAGLYVLPAGRTDPQTPHHEDELYYVVRGHARMRVGSKEPTVAGQAPEDQSEDQAVSAGSVVFVAAGVEHRFYDITEELVVLVVFAPAES
jgi:mannose-6-phosphate isomerase-like protein (cupin superfamily)